MISYLLPSANKLIKNIVTELIEVFVHDSSNRHFPLYLTYDQSDYLTDTLPFTAVSRILIQV